MAKITIVDLEVFYRVGVPDEERAKPQRLLVTVEMSLDLTSAIASDRVERTINYQTVVDELSQFGEGRSWKLIEKLASNIADLVLAKYTPDAVMVEVKKFSIPQAGFVSVSLGKARLERQAVDRTSPLR